MTEVEKRYRILFESNKDGIIRTTPDGHIVEANPAFIRMLGYDRQDAVLGSYKKITPAEWHSIEESCIKEQLKLKGYADEYEKEYYRKDGSKMQASVQLWTVSLNTQTREVWGIIRDISHRKRTQKRLNMAMEQLRKRNHQLVEAREKERKTLATAIHDEIGQSITALRLELELLKQAATCKESCFEKLDKMISISNEVIRNTQRISGDLRPGMLDSVGLKAAIEWFGREWQERTGIKLKLFIENCYINKETELAFFRIVQEALTNVARHAKAKRTSIRLRHNNESLNLVIIDDGIGMPIEKLNDHQSFGLLGMRERAEMCGGELRVSSANGTRIEVIVRFV